MIPCAQQGGLAKARWRTHRNQIARQSLVEYLVQALTADEKGAPITRRRTSFGLENRNGERDDFLLGDTSLRTGPAAL
jgi:hypothetical protein